MTRDGPTVYVYPEESQLERWDERRETLGIESRSRFVADMVEAGIKADRGFSTGVERDETARELRRQRNDLKQELQRARRRIDDLEGQLHRTERETILEYVRENPGAEYDDIVRHVIDDAPARVNQHLEALEGDVLRADPESGGYYAEDGATEDADA